MPDRKHLSWLIWAGWLPVFFIVVFFIWSMVSEKERKDFRGNEIMEVKIGANIFQTEIVATLAKRSQGLSGRKDLCEKCATLFLFEEKGLHSFWMKEMNFDLDMIWIDKNKIVYIVENISKKKEFEVIKPEYEADKILEINAGLVDKLGIKIGDRVEF